VDQENDTEQHSIHVVYAVASGYPSRYGSATVHSLSGTHPHSRGIRLTQHQWQHDFTNAYFFSQTSHSLEVRRKTLRAIIIVSLRVLAHLCSKYVSDTIARQHVGNWRYADGVRRGSAATMNIHVVWLDEFKCIGNTQSLMDCTLTRWTNTSLCNRCTEHASQERSNFYIH